jgi:hypothetical protein
VAFETWAAKSFLETWITPNLSSLSTFPVLNNTNGDDSRTMKPQLSKYQGRNGAYLAQFFCSLLKSPSAHPEWSNSAPPTLRAYTGLLPLHQASPHWMASALRLLVIRYPEIEQMGTSLHASSRDRYFVPAATCQDDESNLGCLFHSFTAFVLYKRFIPFSPFTFQYNFSLNICEGRQLPRQDIYLALPHITFQDGRRHDWWEFHPQ